MYDAHVSGGRSDATLRRATERGLLTPEQARQLEAELAGD